MIETYGFKTKLDKSKNINELYLIVLTWAILAIYSPTTAVVICSIYIVFLLFKLIEIYKLQNVHRLCKATFLTASVLMTYDYKFLFFDFFVSITTILLTTMMIYVILTVVFSIFVHLIILYSKKNILRWYDI